MDGFTAKLTALRHDLYRYPELGFQETRTKAVVADRLRALGIEVHKAGVPPSGGPF